MARKPVTTAPYSPPPSAPASYRPQSFRQRRLAGIKPARGAFNHFPELIAEFPDVLSSIVVETTEAIATEAEAAAPVGSRFPRPAPGTLKLSGTKRYFKNRDGGVVTGRIDFKAAEPNAHDPYHQYAFYVEVGTSHTPAQPFLVPAVVKERTVFNAKLGDLESRL
jgi:hypothetical protein